MRSISQRELRNDNAAVVREVENGASFTVTRRGVPVARLTPLGGPDLALGRSARVRPSYSSMTRLPSVTSTAEVLEDLRGDR